MRKLKRYFENNLEFYKFYRINNNFIDEKLFIRGKCDIRLNIDTYYFETDHRFSTSHDYKAAKIIANDLIQVYLEDQLNSHNLLPQDIRQKGREMPEVYLYLYCIENSLRIFIDEIMKTETINVPRKVQETIDKLKKSEQESKCLPIRGNSDLFYCDFIELGKIIVGN